MQEAWPDYLAGVNWHNGVPAVCMPKEMMTTPYPHGLKSGFEMRPPKPRLLRAESGSCGDSNRDSLNSNELQIARRIAFDFKTKLDCLANSLHGFIQRFCLRVASRQLWYGRDVKPLAIPFDDDVELLLHAGPLPALRRHSLAAVARAAWPS